MVADEQELYALAVSMLARREYSARELEHKLTAKGATPSQLERLLERLVAERLQSDERYTEVYLRQRSGKGYGPLRIRAELRERGIADELIADRFRQAENEGEVDWFELAAWVYAKKYGAKAIKDVRERAKRQRFLQYRGFSHEQIAAAFESE